jgi:hypothetical protein
MSLQPKGPGGRQGFATLSLEYPMSLGVFEKYIDAQKAVDTLSDNQFPVENCLIVGTDLKQMERVTARLTWGRVALGGLLSGVWLGLFVGLILSLFSRPSNPITLLVYTSLYGAVFGLVWSLVGYGFTRGARDFSSVSQVVATRYEVFCEHKFAQQGRQILAQAGIDVGSHSGFGSAPVTPPPGASAPGPSVPPVPPARQTPPPSTTDEPGPPPAV